MGLASTLRLPPALPPGPCLTPGPTRTPAPHLQADASGCGVADDGHQLVAALQEDRVGAHSSTPGLPSTRKPRCVPTRSPARPSSHPPTHSPVLPPTHPPTPAHHERRLLSQVGVGARLHGGALAVLVAHLRLRGGQRWRGRRCRQWRQFSRGRRTCTGPTLPPHPTQPPPYHPLSSAPPRSCARSAPPRPAARPGGR